MASAGGRGSGLRPSLPQSDAVEPDRDIGEFRLGKEIGKGSFATVYIARHVTIGSCVAVKVVPQSKLSKKLKANLNLEIKILKSMQHPHIVALFSCLETHTFFYLVMEYCQMSDLAQFMKKRRTLTDYKETVDIFRRYPNPTAGGLNEVLVRHFFKQIASALHYLRSRNLIHRDIKPQNLLLNPSPIVMAGLTPESQPLTASEHSLVPAVGINSLPMLKIADFGFARHLPSTALAETLCGSPLYMAPEILRYEKYDARADLWSTGTVLYEMVVGKPPFRAQNHVELIHKIEAANDVISFDRNIPISRDMKTVVRKLLRRRPIDRMTYEQLAEDPVVVDDIPNLAPEDCTPAPRRSEPLVSEISRRMASQNLDQASSSPPLDTMTRVADSRPASTAKTVGDDAVREPAETSTRRKSSVSHQGPGETGPQDIRRASERQLQQARRPSIVTHMTAPGRQELQMAPPLSPGTAQKIERRPSRSSPLANPPMVREPSNVRAGDAHNYPGARDVRERTAHDMMIEKEYVVIERRAVEVNAFADELDANANLQNSPRAQAALTRRATTQNPPTSSDGISSSPRTMQLQSTRAPASHHRAGSFERRYAPSTTSAANMLTNALKAANVRLFGAFDASPTYHGLTSPSPPRGYGAFPTYPAPQVSLLIGDVSDGKTPVGEESKLIRTLEEAATRSDVIYSFAEVKYKQLVPATPSAQDALGIQQIGAQGSGNASEEDRDMTITAVVGVAEEALVLYVKTLSILAKTIDLASYWWNKQNRGEILTSEPSARMGGSDTSKRMNSIVQWSRNRFNECLEKSELVGRRLQMAQLELAEGHPSRTGEHSDNAAVGFSPTSSQIRITSGITAGKLMFERAVEMSRTAALAELVGEKFDECEIGYRTSIMLLEAVLEPDDDPYLKKASAKSAEKPTDGIVAGVEDGSRQSVLNLLEGAKARYNNVRRKIAAQQAMKRNSGYTPTAKPSQHGSTATPTP